ncbi:hypothetical protein GBAR_LOCUS25447 [Geodia barretti]|uniref:Uncharacterized protein n=1 Tax=Geodia barretti TaxID=519541 RepID=A0AA35TF81_GEOBA|nr:hypothetical protein GBAR_LOCUS25447 [Geodia barretti]
MSSRIYNVFDNTQMASSYKSGHLTCAVPQTKIVSSSSNKHPYPGGEDSTTDTGGRERGEKAGREEVVMASGHRRRESGGEGGRGGEGEAKRRAGRLNRRTRKKCMKEDVQRMLTRKVRRIQG